MNQKKDTHFGKTILDLARKAYGDDFIFNQCTIVMHGKSSFTVRFDMFEKMEMTEGGNPDPTEMSNFDKLSNLAKHRDGD